MLLTALLASIALVSSARADAPVFSSSFTCDAVTPCGAITSGFSPGRLAVNEATGNVYVIDVAHDAIVVFDSAGVYQSTISGSSTTAGSFAFAAGWEIDIAIDNSGGANQGQIYLVSEQASTLFGGAGGVFSFRADGTYFWQGAPGGGSADLCGVAVNAAGVPHVVDFSPGLREISPADGSGVGAALFGTNQSCEADFDSAGNLYLLTFGGRDVDKYDSSGTFVRNVDADTNLDPAVNRATDDVFIARAADVAQYDSAGTAISGTPFGATELTGGSGLGVAVNSATNRVYVSDNGHAQIHAYDLPAAPPRLSVTVSGAGSGRVDADSGAIAGCTRSSGTCSGGYTAGTEVTLTATPAAGSTFTGWSGAGCTGTGTCRVTLNADESVTASFARVQHRVAVTKNGSGSGSVSSSPAGISCGATCSALFDEGATVTLTARADAGSTFAGWSGAGCSGTGTCRITVTAAADVTATFARIQHRVTVALSGSGSGSVSSSPAGITCGATCSALFDEGASVTLTATPAAGSTFTGWSGAGCSGTGTCRVTTNADMAVTATFTADSTTPPPPPPPAGCPQDVSQCPPGTLVVNSSSATVRRGKAQLRVTCNGNTGSSCNGTLTLTARVKRGRRTSRITVGKVRVSLDAGQSATVTVKLSGPAKSALARRPHKLKATVSGLGVSKTVTLKQAARRKKKRKK